MDKDDNFFGEGQLSVAFAIPLALPIIHLACSQTFYSLKILHVSLNNDFSSV